MQMEKQKLLKIDNLNEGKVWVPYLASRNKLWIPLIRTWLTVTVYKSSDLPPCHTHGIHMRKNIAELMTRQNTLFEISINHGEGMTMT